MICDQLNYKVLLIGLSVENARCKNPLNCPCFVFAFELCVCVCVFPVVMVCGGADLCLSVFGEFLSECVCVVCRCCCCSCARSLVVSVCCCIYRLTVTNTQQSRVSANIRCYIPSIYTRSNQRAELSHSAIILRRFILLLFFLVRFFLACSSASAS